MNAAAYVEIFLRLLQRIRRIPLVYDLNTQKNDVDSFFMTMHTLQWLCFSTDPWLKRASWSFFDSKIEVIHKK